MTSTVRFWRSSFAVLGGLLAFWGLMAALYLEFLRVPQRTGDPPVLACDYGEVFSNGACTSPLWIPVTLMLVGATLATVGLLVFRAKMQHPSDVLRSGAGTHLVLTTLASLFIVPGLYLWMVSGNAGDAGMEEWIRLGTHAYDARPFLAGLMGAGLLSFLGAIITHAAHEQRRRRFLQLRAFQAHEKPPQPPQAQEPPTPRRDDHGRLPPSGFRWEMPA